MSQEVKTLTKQDFDPGVEVRWCPGCGDYSILANVQKLLPTLGVPPERYVFVSGIGCSSRFPYYMHTYGFHSIHGRAPAVATGIRLVNPELKVWIVTGDGDALGIGGNHFIHLLRRNPDVVVLLFNNRIYGLTKGQVSPTSELGKVTKSSPQGSPQYPFNPLLLALGARGSFVARGVYSDAAGLTAVLREAAEHRGTSFVEIFQNCNIFNDGAFDPVSDRAVRDDNLIRVEHGKPLLFGKALNHGISVVGYTPKVVDVEGGDWQGAGVSVYDRTNLHFAHIIASLEPPDFPVPVGVLYQESRETFEELFGAYGEPSAQGRLQALFHSGDTWVEK
jgi:2-oxoglutarate/2-oxoacid ferredoxin oxidoreductase subunit beta